MNIPDVAQQISEVGVLVVIAAVFMYLSVRLINVFIHWLNGTLSHPKVNKKQHAKAMEDRDRIGLQVQSHIEQFIEDFGGSRIQVLEFSNSVQSIAYLPFKYMSCTYEVCQMGNPSKGATIDKIPTSLFSPFFSELHKEDQIVMKLDEMNKAYGRAIYDLLESSAGPDEGDAVCHMLKNRYDKAIGLLIYRPGDELLEYEGVELENLATRISTLLSIRDK